MSGSIETLSGEIKATEIMPNLWVGGHDAFLSLEESGHGPEAILSVLNDSAFSMAPTDRYYMRLPVPDGPGFESWHMALAVDFLKHVHYGMGRITLVHCWSGYSRSVGVVAAYLYRNPSIYHGNLDLSDIDDLMSKLTEARGGDANVTPMPHIREIARKYVA
jgi:predicted protein tyrosine phosphatase